MSNKRRLGLWVIFIGLAGCLPLLPGEVAAEDRPNILFIMADDVGREVLGCYGGESYKTPRLDRLADEGTRFTHGYAMAVCHPTRITLLTGRYPFRFGSKWGAFPKSHEDRTLPHVMKGVGYRTAVAGKWQLTLLKRDTEHPKRLGFDEHCLFGWHEGPRFWQPMLYQNGKVRDDVKDRYGPDVYVEFLADFMKRSKADGKPFFAFYSMALCHDVTDDLKEPVPFAPGRDQYETYAEMVDQMDRVVGNLLDAVDKLGLRDNTVVVFTGDNGTAARSITYVRDGKLVRLPVTSKYQGRMIPGGKGQLTDWGTRVPLIARWPGKTPKGKVVDDMVDMSDYLPTFAELGGVALPEGGEYDGVSFADRLRGTGRGTRDWVFAEHRGKSFTRSRKWKLYDDGRLFDMIKDGDEKSAIRPKIDTPATRSVRDKLSAANPRNH